MALLEGRETVFNAFESGIFSKLEQSEQDLNKYQDLTY